MELALPEPAWLAGRRPHVRLLAEAAAALGGRLELETRYGHVGRYTGPDGRVRPLFGNALGLNADAAAQLAADKDYTARLLAAAGLPTPPGILVFGPAYRAEMALKNAAVAADLPGPAAARAFAEAQGWPVIAKPNGGSEGRAIHLCAEPAALDAALASLFATDQKIRVEARIPGRDYRLVVLDGQVRLAYARSPVEILGDGRSTVAELLGALRGRLAATTRGPKLDPADPRIVATLAAQGLGLASRPVPGRRVRLLPNANLSTGGTCEDLADRVLEPAATLAIRAAAHLGLRLAGVDLLAPDLARATVLEVNSAPGLDGYASSSPEAWARARRLLADALAAP